MKEILEYLQELSGKAAEADEVCGTHTLKSTKRYPRPSAAFHPAGIRAGCPVCVTVTEYIDRLIDLGKEPQNIIVTFGDMLRARKQVQPERGKGRGCRVKWFIRPWIS